MWEPGRDEVEAEIGRGVYWKWAGLILGPALVLAGLVFYYLHRDKAGMEREKLDEVHDEGEVHRIRAVPQKKALRGWDVGERFRVAEAERLLPGGNPLM